MITPEQQPVSPYLLACNGCSVPVNPTLKCCMWRGRLHAWLGSGGGRHAACPVDLQCRLPCAYTSRLLPAYFYQVFWDEIPAPVGMLV